MQTKKFLMELKQSIMGPLYLKTRKTIKTDIFLSFFIMLITTFTT